MRGRQRGTVAVVQLMSRRAGHSNDGRCGAVSKETLVYLETARFAFEPLAII